MSDRYQNDMGCGIEPEREGDGPTLEQWRDRCRQLWKENVNLRAELQWAWAEPDDACSSKCDWCKGVDPNGCYCGRKEWQEAKPEHMKSRP